MNHIGRMAPTGVIQSHQPEHKVDMAGCYKKREAVDGRAVKIEMTSVCHYTLDKQGKSPTALVGWC